MAFCDFVIKYNPEKDNPIDISRRIIYSIFLGRVKARKPVTIFLSGDSGEGKSFGGLKLIEELLTMQGLNPLQYKEDVNVITPYEYADKLNNMLYNKDLKKVNVFCVHEAREVVKAKLWHSFLNQSISDINALQRSVKRLITIIISQFIRDISTDIRYTLNFYIKASRPRNQHTRLYINILWKDDRDLDKPKLRKRKLSGYLVYPDGTYQRYVPKYLEVTKPSVEMIDWFEVRDRDAKSKIITKKIQRLMLEMKKEIGEDTNKVNFMVDFYIKNIQSLEKIGTRIKGKWKIMPNIREMHDLTITEALQFEDKINKLLQDKAKEINNFIEGDNNG